MEKCFVQFLFTPWYVSENSLVRFLTLLNSWIKIVRAHFPWSNLYFLTSTVRGASNAVSPSSCLLFLSFRHIGLLLLHFPWSNLYFPVFFTISTVRGASNAVSPSSCLLFLSFRHMGLLVCVPKLTSQAVVTWYFGRAIWMPFFEAKQPNFQRS